MMRDNEYEFYKDNPDDRIWKVSHIGYAGELLFSFNRKKIYYLWTDYPWKFTQEEKRIFYEEKPFWAEFFKDRSESKDESDK